MIKMVLKAKDSNGVLVLGLSHANLRELKKGRPIMVKAAALGIEGPDVLIMSGLDEESIMEELKGHMGVHDGIVDLEPKCAREGCDKPLAYAGAQYCGASCSAQRKEPKK